MLITSLLAIAPIAAAWGQESRDYGILTDRLRLDAGVVWHKADGDFTSTRTGQPTTSVSLDDLGINDDDFGLWISGRFRFLNRWSVQVDHFGFRNDGSSSAEFDFNFEDLIVPIGAHVTSDVQLGLLVVNLGYDVLQRDRSRVRLGIGTHVARLEFDIDAELSAGGVITPLGEDETDFLAPLPNLYLSGTHLLMDRLAAHLSAGWMSMSYDDYDGDLWFLRGQLDYRITPRFGIGAGYSFLSADIDRDTGSKKENYDVQLPGPFLVFSAGF